MTTEELQQAGETWKQVHFSTVLSKRNAVESPDIPKYDLKVVKDKIRIMQKVVIPPFLTEESQQNISGPSDCIQAVSDDVETETQVVLTDPEPKCKGDAIYVQCVQTVHELNYWINTIWGWAKSLFWHQ